MARTEILLLGVFQLGVFANCSNNSEQQNDADLPPTDSAPSDKAKSDHTTPDVGAPRQLALMQSQDISARLLQDQPVGRPDAVVIDDTIHLAFGSGPTPIFYLKRLRANVDLESAGPTESIYGGENGKAVDIRVAKDASGFWYAFEDFLNVKKSCGTHFLNAARYRITPQLARDKTLTNLASGCITVLPEAFSVNAEDVPENPEAVDDPTPLFFQQSYYILTRAWSGWIPEFTHNTIHRVRRLDSSFTLAESFPLDLSSVFAERTLSQNALVDIDGTPTLIAGFYSNRRLNVAGSVSDIYAVPLTRDLKGVAGEKIPLIKDARWVFKSTSAVYVGKHLYINYQTFGEGMGSQWLAAFDVTRGYSKVADVELHRSEPGTITANHTSVVAKGDLVFAFYPNSEKAIEAKVFQWQ